jgi:hypothetical protein
MNPIEWAKANPIPATLIVGVGGVVVFVILSSSGSGGVAATSVSGPSDAQIAAEAQLQALRIQGADAASARQAQVQLGQFERDIELEQTRASLSAIESNNETSLAVETIRSTRDQNLARLNADVSMRGFAAQELVAGYEYQAAARQSEAQLEAARLNTSAAVQITTINNQNQLDLARIQQETTVSEIGRDVTMNRDNIGGLVTIANVNAQTQTQVAQLESSTAIQAAQIQANAARRANRDNGIFSAIGSIAGVVGSIFSDQRMKSNIRYEGEEPNTGLPLYSYTMGDEWRLGFMAQDIALHYPDAIRRGSGDQMMYDPRMLN